MWGLQSVEEHAESEPEVVWLTPKATRSRSSSQPYPLIDVPQSENVQSEESTATNPELAQPDKSEAPAQPSDGPRRSKRARHCSGYYTDIHKGK